MFDVKRNWFLFAGWMFMLSYFLLDPASMEASGRRKTYSRKSSAGTSKVSPSPSAQASKTGVVAEAASRENIIHEAAYKLEHVNADLANKLYYGSEALDPATLGEAANLLGSSDHKLKRRLRKIAKNIRG